MKLYVAPSERLGPYLSIYLVFVNDDVQTNKQFTIELLWFGTVSVKGFHHRVIVLLQYVSSDLSYMHTPDC